MIFFFLLVGLLFLVSGGIGLFYVNASGNIEAASALFVVGNTIFSVFLVFGVLILIFMAVYNAEFG